MKSDTMAGTAEYAYNAAGLRVAKTVNGVLAKYVWDGGQIAAELSGSGSVTARYTCGIGLIKSDTSWYLFNAHGDVTQLTDSVGTVTRDYDYDALGIEGLPDSADINPFRYAGEYYDRETGTYYLRARYYSPGTGRFITQDPIRDGLNWYTYCENNPIAFIDPLGLALLRDYVNQNNGSVTWNEKTRTATATVNGITRWFTADTYGIFINNNGRMDVPDDILAAAFTKASQVIVDNQGSITGSANNHRVDANALASVIYTEQNYYVNLRDHLDYTAHMVGGLNTSMGVAQMSVSTAVFLENEGYMPMTTGTLRFNRWQVIATRLTAQDSESIDYAAAYLAYFQDVWTGEYPSIADDPGILGTLYNNGHYDSQGNLRSPHSNPMPSPEFGVYVQQHYNAMGYLLGIE